MRPPDPNVRVSNNSYDEMSAETRPITRLPSTRACQTLISRGPDVAKDDSAKHLELHEKHLLLLSVTKLVLKLFVNPDLK